MRTLIRSRTVSANRVASPGELTATRVCPGSTWLRRKWSARPARVADAADERGRRPVARAFQRGNVFAARPFFQLVQRESFRVRRKPADREPPRIRGRFRFIVVRYGKKLWSRCDPRTQLVPLQQRTLRIRRRYIQERDRRAVVIREEPRERVRPGQPAEGAGCAS